VVQPQPLPLLSSRGITFPGPAHRLSAPLLACALQVSPRTSTISTPANASLELPLPAWSLSILSLSVVPPTPQQ
jgi:hypothetical protein